MIMTDEPTPKIYRCETCDYTTDNRFHFSAHSRTKAHKNRQNRTPSPSPSLQNITEPTVSVTENSVTESVPNKPTVASLPATVSEPTQQPNTIPRLPDRMSRDEFDKMNALIGAKNSVSAIAASQAAEIAARQQAGRPPGVGSQIDINAMLMNVTEIVGELVRARLNPQGPSMWEDVGKAMFTNYMANFTKARGKARGQKVPPEADMVQDIEGGYEDAMNKIVMPKFAQFINEQDRRTAKIEQQNQDLLKRLNLISTDSEQQPNKTETIKEEPQHRHEQPAV